jgi:alcohol dehydrogenase
MPRALTGFSLSRLPRIEFGAGTIRKLPAIAAGYGRHALVLTGAASFVGSEPWLELTRALAALGVAVTHVQRSAGEPTPEDVDAKVTALRGAPIDVVIGIGGGSVLDEAKAIAGLLRTGR